MVKHVLVIRLSALGDAAIAAPVLRRWAMANADVRFTMAAPPMLAPLFDEMPANVDFLGVDKRQSARALCRCFQSAGADAVANLHHVNRVDRALRLMRLEALVHHTPLTVSTLHKGRLSRWLMLRHLDMRPRRPQHQRYGDVFLRLGLTPPPPDNHTVAPLHNASRRIGFAPFAQHQGKIWPMDLGEKLVAMLSERGYQVVLFGSRGEAPTLEQWAARHEGVTSAAGRYSFAEEMEVIGHLQLMVSMDSANMHFASALGVPVVSIWGATHPDFGFYGYGQPRELAISSGRSCQPCSAYGNRRCRYGDYRCLRDISPDAVLEKIETIFEK